MCRRMHSDAVCAGIRPLSGLREGISFLITAAISCTCGCRLRRLCIGTSIGYCGWWHRLAKLRVASIHFGVQVGCDLLQRLWR